MEVNNNPIFAKLNVRAFELGMDALKKLDKIEQIISDYEEYKWDRIEVSDIRRILDGDVD